jgi:hypothetical protein
MLCILSFIIFLIFFPILGFFKEYRILFRRALECFTKKITFKPCDINFGDELKGKLLGKIAIKYPKITLFLEKTFGFWAFLFVAINIWSLVLVILSGLNLYVYDTCEPDTGQSCSLGGQACGVALNTLTFGQAIEENRFGEYVTQPFTILGETISRIPDRTKNWQAKEYLPPSPTYYTLEDKNKPYAVEMIDPGCEFCAQLFKNTKEAEFYQKYNLTYVLYPIPDNTTSTGYKFQASKTIASYLEALKQVPLEGKETPTDWQLLEIIFTRKDDKGARLQFQFNFTFTKNQIEPEIEKLLVEIGYNQEQIARIKEIANSEQVSQSLDKQKEIVEQKVRTNRIPTIIFDGRRYDRVLEVDKLKSN